MFVPEVHSSAAHSGLGLHTPSVCMLSWCSMSLCSCHSQVALLSDPHLFWTHIRSGERRVLGEPVNPVNPSCFSLSMLRSPAPISPVPLPLSFVKRLIFILCDEGFACRYVYVHHMPAEDAGPPGIGVTNWSHMWVLGARPRSFLTTELSSFKPLIFGFLRQGIRL